MITSLLYTLFLSSSTSTFVDILDKTHVYQVSYETEIESGFFFIIKYLLTEIRICEEIRMH